MTMTDPSNVRPILMFDSGIGGLTVLREARVLMPDRRFVYVADDAAFPYGAWEEPALRAHILELFGKLLDRFSPAISVIACNTASTLVIDALRERFPGHPFVGTVPAIKPAAEHSRSRVIGVLGTEATVRQPYVDKLAREFAPDCTLLRHGSAELVALAEAKLAGKPVNPAAVADAVRPLQQAVDLDTVVLACTHFRLVEDELAAALPGVAFVDGAAGIARRIAWLTRDQQWPEAAPPGIAVFTGAAPSAELAKALADYGLDEIRTL